ncbi:hypothetical protein EW338_16500 [Salmonella enterica subsp. enterica serovar Richmond]|nr:hypothetical protein [Salmonella enterica subsp. enterica serovar Richmond]ECG3313275.1 hypothetical protein [Salmonella enterica subsp. enterica serovar Richmond]
MKKNLIALTVFCALGGMGITAAHASTYSEGASVEVTANVVNPTSVSAQFSPAADHFSPGDINNGVTIGTVTISANETPTGWWFSVPSNPITKDTTAIQLKDGDSWFSFDMPEGWEFSTDNGGIMWRTASASSVSFDVKATKGSGYYTKPGKYSVVLSAGTYMS